MSNYTKTTNFGAKDTLPSGDSQKIIRGTEFDTEFNNVATAIATKLEVDGSNNLAISGTFSSTKLIPTGGTATGNGMYLPAANTLALSTNGVERVRVDSSGNLGVGSIAPVGYSGYSGVTIQNTNGGFINLRNAANTNQMEIAVEAGNTGYVKTVTSIPLIFGTNNAERARIDSSGNVGIGTASPGAKLDVDGGIRAAVGSATLAAIGAGDLTINASNAAGQIAFRTAGSERARIDSAGNLTVGQSTSNATLADAGYLSIKNTANTSGFDIGLLGGSSDINAFIYQRANGYLAFGTNNAERARITSGGQLCLGVTAANGSARFTVGGLTTGTAAADVFVGRTGTEADGVGLGASIQLQNNTNTTACIIQQYSNNLQFFNYTGAAWTERARITSAGNLYVGTTSPGADGRLAVDGADTYYAGMFTQGAATSNCIAVHNRATSGDNSFILFMTEGGTGTARGSINYNRAGGGVSYNTTSDYRAKDIIGPLTNTGATIDALKVYEGKMKDATQSRPMLIAHEAQEYAPYAVSGVKDEVNEDGTPKFQQMDVSYLVPLLLAEIQSLRARVATLENN